MTNVADGISRKGPLSILLLIAAASPLMAQQPLSIESGGQDRALTVSVRPRDGSYVIRARGLDQPVLVAHVGARIDREWVNSLTYPRHNTEESTFTDALGPGHALVTTFSGLSGRPDMIVTLRVYDGHAYGDVSVAVRNTTAKKVTVQSIRCLEATDQPVIDLGGPLAADRVMEDSYSEDPTMQIVDLASAAGRPRLRGVRSQLVYNRTSGMSLLVAALTSEKFLTQTEIAVGAESQGVPRITLFQVDSTGTTQPVNERDHLARDQRVELSLPIEPGQSLASERVMLAAGPDYHAQLEDYGEAIRILHHARVSRPAPMGWWSWTTFYAGVREGEVLTNARWLAAHLRSLGFDYLHLDEGYQYARGEYTTANATQFPHGMAGLEREICRLGLIPGIWTAPFEVSARAWVYEHHQDWLVHDAQGKPILVDRVGDHDPTYALDTTHPGAQEYLRQTYRTLTREWGIRYIKLDFMDSSAVEGYRHKPGTTALEAQRLGLEIIRQAVGEDVLLDKDGSPMLNPVGLVDEGRISVDTAHSFQSSLDAAPNIAARYYMNRNFYVSDPDAFNVSRQMIPGETWRPAKEPLTLSEAQVAIVLAAVAGGMYEIGDDLPTLGADPERLALVENLDLLRMVQLGRAATPLDLMSFLPEDELPSVFFLKEDQRQAMLAVFNWTQKPRSHSLALGELKLAPAHPYQAADILNPDAAVSLDATSLRLEDQPPHSVRLIKLIDTSVPASAPTVQAQAPSAAKAGDPVKFTAAVGADSVPALAYRWDFGDGTTADGAVVSHTYTKAGTFGVKLSVEGVDGLAADQTFSVAISGHPSTRFDLEHSRRYLEEAKH